MVVSEEVPIERRPVNREMSLCCHRIFISPRLGH